MKKITATYKAPKGDSKVVEMLGHSFFDGKAEEVVLDDFQAEILERNPLFECSKPVDVDPKEHAKEQQAKAAAKDEPAPHKEKAR